MQGMDGTYIHASNYYLAMHMLKIWFVEIDGSLFIISRVLHRWPQKVDTPSASFVKVVAYV